MIQQLIDHKCEGIFTARSNLTSATQNNNGNHENRRPNVDSIVYYGKRSRTTEEFQSLLSPLKVVDHKTFKKGKKEKNFFSDSQDSSHPFTLLGLGNETTVYQKVTLAQLEVTLVQLKWQSQSWRELFLETQSPPFNLCNGNMIM